MSSATETSAETPSTRDLSSETLSPARTPSSSVLKTPPSTRRHSYDVDFKLMIVQWHRRNGSNVSRTAREFHVDRKRVRDWEGRYESLLQHNRGKEKKRRRIGSGRVPLSSELDQKVFEFLEEERSEGVPVSNKQLKARALQIAGGLGLSGFHASEGWLRRWKRRFGVGYRCFTNTSQKVPKDYEEKLQQFRKSIITIRKAKDIPPSRIINMDQTMCRFDMPPRGTNDKIGKKTIRGKTTKAEKKGFTVALAATASGEKLPAAILFKEKNGVLGKRVKSKLTIPGNVCVRASANGWMTREEYHHWLTHVYKAEDESRLLVVDSYKPHISDESREIVVSECNSSLVIIPGGCTSIAQPMDRSVNKPFKDSMRESWTSWMKLDRATTRMGNLKQPTRQDVINWVSKAWASIKVETLTKSFLSCGISNALDGSEDDCVNSDIPPLDISELDEEEDEEEVEDDDVDNMGNPFSDDENDED